MLFIRVYFPLALGYAISYFYRNANAIIEGDLVRELELGAAELGLLTSVYFISFAAFQLPLGVLLDRYGPRRTEAVLLLFAALGAVLFAQAESLTELIVARLLIGLGVSACLMAAFKAYVIWFPSKRLPMINGFQMVAGGLGALGATTPLQEALSFTDWRGVFMALAGMTVFAALLIWVLQPERVKTNESEIPSLATQFNEMGEIFRSRLFWSIAPFAALSQGFNLAIHGLWAKPWLRDVAKLNEAESAQMLFLMTLAVIGGFLSLGIIADRLSHWIGINPIEVGVAGMCVFLLAQSIMAMGWVEFPLILMLVLGFSGTSSILVYSGYAQLFPKNLSGRVSTTLNLLVFATAFAAQWGVGVIIQLWPSTTNGYDPQSYSYALGLLSLFMLVSLIWYAVSKVKINLDKRIPD